MQTVSVEGVTRGINYGSNKVRFMHPVKVGKRVRLRQKLAKVEPRAGGLTATKECSTETEGEKRPPCAAEPLAGKFDE